jgi:hypothetical protein
VTLPVSLILIAVGAILVWGVTSDAEGINVDAVGVILMVIGFVGFLLSLILGPPWGPGWFRRTEYVEGEAPRHAYRGGRRRVVEEEVEEDAPPPAGPPY